MARVTKDEALKVIAAAGWKQLHPDESPLYHCSYYDGVDRSIGRAWLSAYDEIKRRERPQQLSLFPAMNCDGKDN